MIFDFAYTITLSIVLFLYLIAHTLFALVVFPVITLTPVIKGFTIHSNLKGTINQPAGF